MQAFALAFLIISEMGPFAVIRAVVAAFAAEV
jgi:hypothetical protein